MIKRPFSVTEVPNPSDPLFRVNSLNGPLVNYYTGMKICGIEPTADRLGELAHLLNVIYSMGIEDARTQAREALGIGRSAFGEFIHKA